MKTIKLPCESELKREESGPLAGAFVVVSEAKCPHCNREIRGRMFGYRDNGSVLPTKIKHNCNAR